MDPHVTWSELARSVTDEDWAEAAALADVLLTWLNRGGFPPAISGLSPFDAIVAKAACESIVRRGV